MNAAARQAADERIAGMRGAAALPRANGELVFSDPWQGRAFGIAVALHQAGRYDWAEFQQRLIEEIRVHGDDDASADDASADDYYGHWLVALERLLVERGVVDAGELARRTAEYRSGERDEVF